MCSCEPCCSAAPAASALQLLLSQDYDDEWLDNPVVAGSWGLSWSFKEEFDDAFQVMVGGAFVAAGRVRRESVVATAIPVLLVHE